MPRSIEPDPMATVLLLKEMDGPRPIIPLDIAGRDSFPHLTPEKLPRKVSAGEIALPLLRIEDSVRCQKGVFPKDLARWIDDRAEAARGACRQPSRGSGSFGAAITCRRLRQVPRLTVRHRDSDGSPDTLVVRVAPRWEERPRHLRDARL